MYLHVACALCRTVFGIAESSPAPYRLCVRCIGVGYMVDEAGTFYRVLPLGDDSFDYDVVEIVDDDQ